MTTPQPSDPVETLGLSPRPYNALRRNNIHTIGDLTRLDQQELSDIRNIGIASLGEVLHALYIHGLKLKEQPAPERAR